jgi:hypothetical protein
MGHQKINLCNSVWGDYMGILHTLPPRKGSLFFEGFECCLSTTLPIG